MLACFFDWVLFLNILYYNYTQNYYDIIYSMDTTGHSTEYKIDAQILENTMMYSVYRFHYLRDNY